MGYSDFGLKIGIDGEKEFKNSLRDINMAFKVLGSEMALVTSQFDKNDKSVSSLTSRNTVLDKSISAQKDKIGTLKDALDNATKSFGKNDQRTQKWQIQLNKAQAELNDMEHELDNNTKALKDVERGVNDAGQKLDEFGNVVEDNTKKTSIFGDVLKANLATEAIKAGVKAIINLFKEIGAAIKGYISGGSEMAHAAAEGHALLTQVMRNTMDASDAEVQSLEKLVETQEKLGVVSKTSQTIALAELASFVGRKESLEDMLPVMNDYIAYQYGMTASEEQARNVATALGKAIDGNLDGLSKQGFKLEEGDKKWFKTATEAERVAFVMDMVSESMNGVNESLAQTDAGKMQRLNNVLSNTQIAVGELANSWKAQVMGQMLPSISSLSDAFLGLLHGEGSVEDLAAGFNDVFEQLSETITTFIPNVLELGSKLIESFVSGISNNTDVIIGGVLTVIDMFSGAIVDLVPTLVDAGIPILMGLVRGVISALPKLADAATQIITSLVNGIGDSLPELIPATVEAIMTLALGLVDNLPLLMGAVLKIVLGLAQGIIDSLPVIISKLPEIINSLVEALLDQIPMIIDAGFQLLTALVAATPEIVSALIKTIPTIIKGIYNAFIQAKPKIVEAGSNLLKGLWQGMQNVADWVWNQVKGFCNQIVARIKNFFGIHSPSTLFAEIGGFLGKGLGVGFVNTMDRVSKDMQNAIPTNFDIGASINAGFNSVAAAGAAMFGCGGSVDTPTQSGSKTINQNITQHIHAENTSYADQQREASRQFMLIARELPV